MDNIFTYTEDNLLSSKQPAIPWLVDISDFRGVHTNEIMKAVLVVYLHNYQPYIIKDRYSNNYGYPTEEDFFLRTEEDIQKEIETVKKETGTEVRTICNKQQKFLASILKDARYNHITYDEAYVIIKTLQRCWYVPNSIVSSLLNKIRIKFPIPED